MTNKDTILEDTAHQIRDTPANISFNDGKEVLSTIFNRNRTDTGLTVHDIGLNPQSQGRNRAVLNQQLMVLKRLLNQRNDIDSKQDDGQTILHCAAWDGRLDIVKILLGQGANIETKNKKGATPLHYAAWKGQVEVLNILLDQGANIESRKNNGATPLHQAALNGQLKVVKTLLKRGANIESRKDNGETPLYQTVRTGQVEVVKFLLDQGANIEVKKDYGQTALHYAAWSGRLEVVKILLYQGANIESREDDGETPLHQAAWNGQLAVVKILLNQGANIESRKDDGETPLHQAAWMGQLPVFEELLDRGANINAQQDNGLTPLDYARRFDHMKRSQKLRIFEQEISGETKRPTIIPLHEEYERHRELLQSSLDQETKKKKLSYESYTVGWICALSLELAAATAMLDESHARLPQSRHDHNTYILGNIAGHNIVITCLPSGVYGTTSAAVVASQMLSTFPAIRFGLMVGIGGGVPSNKHDIRLGDVVVSNPADTSGGVLQYDYGKTVSSGNFQRTGVLNKPPQVLLTALSVLQAEEIRGESLVERFLLEMLHKHPAMRTKFTYRGESEDRLFDGEYDHVMPGSSCTHCDERRLILRPRRAGYHPVIHYGLIASGNQVMKHGRTRDHLARQLDILCFEMEAAGLMDNFPCLVIRGISDYADSHKNKAWQEYAAATAAAYAKRLLSVTSITAMGDP